MIKSTRIVVAFGVVAVLGLLAMAISGSQIATPVAQAQTLPQKKPFMVFDGTLYTNKPDLAQYGIQPVNIAYAGQFGSQWFKNAAHLPDKATVQQIARQAKIKANRVVLDIEHWPLHGNPNQVQSSLSKYMTVLQWFKEAAPGLPVGYYGAPPLGDYWKTLKPPTSKEWASFARENDQLKPLAAAVDILFPSLYTFYTDRGGWVRYAYGQIAEARRYGNGKPVYVFLWPQYHDSNPSLKGAYLPADYWRLQLEMARQYADGIVIWGGWGSDNRAKQWNNNAAWWGVTKEFMKKVATTQP
jgi:hypothetical protein